MWLNSRYTDKHFNGCVNQDAVTDYLSTILKDTLIIYLFCTYMPSSFFSVYSNTKKSGGTAHLYTGVGPPYTECT